jgi:tyrosyl-tRNA synthetase
MDFLSDLRWRGLVYDLTPELEQHLAEATVTAYIGFDPTADSLHVGSLLPVMALARFQRHGHVPIAIVGGGTGLIGDPSGKANERTLLDREQVAHNLRGIRAQLERFIDFSPGPRAARIIDNADWLATIPLTDFLRDVGKHFTVNYMIAKESVRRRLEGEEGLSFTEFSYMLLQAYDFLVLHDLHGWNITAGAELVRRVRGARAHGLVMPLVTNAAGTKFGKTEAGTIWLDAARTSPYRFYQFWLNTDDRDAGPYLRYFTWLGPEEVAALDHALATAPQEREAQRVLAREVTRMVHGEDALAAAERATEVLFSGDVAALSAAELAEVFEDAPTAQLPASALDGEGLAAVDLLVEAGVAPSKGEARRLVAGGGVSVNGRRVEEAQRVTRADAVGGEMLVIRKGRKAYTLVRLLR